MKLDEWLTTVPIKQTPKGARLDLRLHVYPDGHGDFCVEDEKGRSCSKPQPVNNPAEARGPGEDLESGHGRHGWVIPDRSKKDAGRAAWRPDRLRSGPAIRHGGTPRPLPARSPERMSHVFADAFYYFAILNPNDTAHDRALAYATAHDDPVVTTAWVLTELADGLAATGHRARSRGLRMAWVEWRLRGGRPVPTKDSRSFAGGCFRLLPAISLLPVMRSVEPSSIITAPSSRSFHPNVVKPTTSAGSRWPSLFP